MITKVQSVEFSAGANNLNKFQKTQASPIAAANTLNLSGANWADSLSAQNGVSFTGQKALTDLERSFIGESEIRIQNILDLNQNVHMYYKQMPKDKIQFNTKGLHVETTQEDGKKVITISNGYQYKIFQGKFDPDFDTSNMVLTYKQGKYMPEITVKSTALGGKIIQNEHGRDIVGGKKIKMLAGSEIIGNGFELKMQGSYQPAPDRAPTPISFAGHITMTTLNKEQKTVDAFNLYYNSDLPSHAIEGDYAKEMQASDPNMIFPIGGMGERFGNMARTENKPSAQMPTRNEYRMVASTLNLAASARLLGNPEVKDHISYVSQKGEIQGDNVFYSGKYKTDGGAIAEALARDIIRNDKDTVILNGDIFTNADITRAYHALKTLPDAALVIPYYPVNPERAKSFGLLGIEKDDNGNLQISDFLEKPKYTEIPDPNKMAPGEYTEALDEFTRVQQAAHPDFEHVYLANPGMYFMSKEATKVLMSQGILNPEKTGLGANVMPLIVSLCNEGKLKTKDGRPMKVYTVPLEAKDGKPAVWEDIGTAEAYLRIIKDVAWETKTYGPDKGNKYYGMPAFMLNDFMKNSDLETGIVYGGEDSRNMFDNFKNRFGVTSARGNIFVSLT